MGKLSNSDRTWWGGQRHGRRPISRRRRWIGFAALGLLIVGAGTYHQLTREPRLRRFAERWLAQFSGGQTLIERVRFDLFHGLHLVGVTVAVPQSAHFDPLDNRLDARTVFRCSTLFLRLRPLSIISGNLVVPEIVAVDPELRLVRRTGDGLRNWEVMLGYRKWRRKVSADPLRLPVIRLRNLRVRQYRLDERGRSGGAAQLVWADAQPLADRPEVYDVEITKIIQPPDSGEMAGESARLEIDTRTLSISGSLPTMTIEDLLLAASPELTHWLDVLALRGYVRPDTFCYDSKSAGRATLTLGGASFSIPLDKAEESLPPRQRYLWFEQMAGAIRFDQERAHVELEGRLRDSPLQVRGELQLARQVAAGLDAMGFDLELTASEVRLPRMDEGAGPEQVHFVCRWPRLEKFVHDYDGMGRVDLALTLHKSPGAGKGVEFIEGTLTPRGASGRYFRFPYRVSDLSGTVHFRRDGNVELKDLKGRHGSGRVVINGLLGGYVSQSVDLDIQGEDIDLDPDLLRCLPRADQDLCRRFDARARMNLRVQLHRDDVPHGMPGVPWKTVIDATFTDGSVNFASFPYPLKELAGRMRIAGGGFEIDRLTAVRGNARVSVSGWAKRSKRGPASLDLALEATGIPLDAMLANALPDAARERYARLTPSGRADRLAGRVFTRPGGGRIGYDLRASLSNAALTLPGTSARLVDTRAAIRIVPDRLVIESLSGTFGRSTITLAGQVGMRPGDPEVSLRLRSERLALDDALYEALPASLRRTWDAFKPHGQLGLDVLYERSPPASQPGGGAKPMVDYTATIEPIDCDATFSRFPLPLTGINGRLIVKPAGVVIEQATARHEQAAFELEGRVQLLPGKTNVELAVDVSDLTFSEALRKAVPWRLRRLWNDVKPQGTVDLSLERLGLTVRPGKVTSWDFQGEASLEDVAIAIGPKLTGVRGRVAARGKVGPPLSIEGDLSFAAVRVDGRLVTEVTAAMSRPPGDSVFRLSEIVGRFYDGMIAGWAEVDYAAGGPTYGLSLTARNIALGKFLNARRLPEEKPLELQGRVNGNLALAGRLGEPRTRRGGGSVLIREAQMFKVPLMLAILQVIHFAIDDDSAFHDGTFRFGVDGEQMILEEIDLRGKAFSMVGAGRVHTPTQEMDLTLLVGSPFRLPRVWVLSEFLEGVAREVMEVHVEGTLDEPQFRAEVVRSLKKTLDTILNARRKGKRPRFVGQ